MKEERPRFRLTAAVALGFFVLGSAVFLAASETPSAAKIRTLVDPRVELMSIHPGQRGAGCRPGPQGHRRHLRPAHEGGQHGRDEFRRRQVSEDALQGRL